MVGSDQTINRVTDVVVLGFLFAALTAIIEQVVGALVHIPDEVILPLESPPGE